MATTYTVYIAFTGGKGSSVSFRYPGTTDTTGTGHTSGSPLQISAGDNVKFVEVTGSLGGGTVSGLALFTDNTDFSYSGGDGIGEIADRTVATGTTPSAVDTITATTGVGGNTDNFYFQRVAPPTDPPTISHVRHNEPNGSTATVTVLLEDSGSGGTALEYAQSTTTSVPATGWQSSNTGFSQTRGTTRYYWASRDQDTANEFDGPEELTIPTENPHVTTLTSQNYGIEVANSTGKILYSTNRRSLVLIKQQQVTLSAGASSTITNIDNPEDIDQTFVLIGDQDDYVSTGTGNPVAVTGRSDSARTVTVTNQDNVTSRTVRVMVYRIC